MDVEKTIEFILSMQAKAEVEMRDLRRQTLATENTLRRAVGLAVREARAERVRRKEMEARLNESLDRLSAEVQAFIASMPRGGDGSH